MKTNQVLDIGKVSAKKKINADKWTEYKVELRSQITHMAIDLTTKFKGDYKHEEIEKVSDILFTFLVLGLQNEDLGMKVSVATTRVKALNLAWHRYKDDSSLIDLDLKIFCEEAEKYEGTLLRVGVTEKKEA